MEFTSQDWNDVYINRIHKIPIKKISEFMYKIIQKLIVCRHTLKRWNRTDSDKCPVCNELETIKHIYFECPRVNEMWRKLGKCLKVEITWKKILFGYIQDIVQHRVRNLVFSIILYCLFKNWIGSMQDKLKYKTANIVRLIKSELKCQTFFFKYSSLLVKDKFNSMLESVIAIIMQM